MFFTRLPFDTTEKNSSLCWLPEESFPVDCEISKENTIKIKYSICFKNNSNNIITFSLAAKFKKKDCSNWLEYDFLEGCNKNGELLYTQIKPGEKLSVPFVFEGTYLGGEISKELSFPEELIIMEQ